MKIFVLIIGIILCFIGYSVWKASQVLGGFGECFMDAGPIYGNKIEIIESFPLEQQINTPNGKLGLAHLSDSLAPILVKYNKQGGILWAVEFLQDSAIIPHRNLSEMKLMIDEYPLRLSFFNYSYSESGTIYLDDNYDFKYMCLSPM